MLGRRLLVAALLFTVIFASLEILCSIFPTLLTIVSAIVIAALCMFVTGMLFTLIGENSLKNKIDPKGKTVFITGCDSGFGYKLAKRLDSKGYAVFAGCLFPHKEGGFELKNTCSERLRTVQIDVTSDESVQKAKEFVKSNLEKSELWAVVNNAGIFRGFETELCTINHFKACLEVNVLGQVRVAKAFLPLLRASKGRIINVNSRAGRFNISPMTAYCVSKHASVSFTECLRQEMARWGVHVISVEPEFFRTTICNKQVMQPFIEEVKKESTEEIEKLYGDVCFEKMPKFIERISSPNVDIVVRSMEGAISDKYPEREYHPSRNWAVQLILYFGQHLAPKVLIDSVARINSYVNFQ